MEGAAGAEDGSGTGDRSPFAAIQLFRALSPGGTGQASPVTELGHCTASEAAWALWAAPGCEPGTRAATWYWAVLDNGAAEPGRLVGMLMSCVTMTYVTFLCLVLSVVKGGDSNSATSQGLYKD